MKLNDVYKCNICGNIVELVHVGGGQLVCCGQPMQLMEENAVDASSEKHIPVIQKSDKGILVKIGSAPHPMEEKHFIEWIELVADGVVCRKYLKPGQKPEALFEIKAVRTEARAYCNLHGLWKK